MRTFTYTRYSIHSPSPLPMTQVVVGVYYFHTLTIVLFIYCMENSYLKAPPRHAKLLDVQSYAGRARAGSYELTSEDYGVV